MLQHTPAKCDTAAVHGSCMAPHLLPPQAPESLMLKADPRSCWGCASVGLHAGTAPVGVWRWNTVARYVTCWHRKGSGDHKGCLSWICTVSTQVKDE